MASYVVATLSKYPDLLLRFCQSVRDAGETAEIVVADDGLPPSLDLSPFSPVVRILCPKPFVYSRNANLIAAARPDSDIFLANDDSMLRGSLKFLAETAARPGIGIVSTSVEGAVCNPLQQRTSGGVLDAGEQPICFVAVYLSRKVLQQLGPLDERFVGYGYDDVDYCRRARLAGLRNVVDTRCLVAHPKSSSSFLREPNYVALVRASREEWNKKWGENVPLGPTGRRRLGNRRKGAMRMRLR